MEERKREREMEEQGRGNACQSQSSDPNIENIFARASNATLRCTHVEVTYPHVSVKRYSNYTHTHDITTLGTFPTHQMMVLR